MYTVADLRKGLRIEIEGVPYHITDFTFVKPGKGQAIYTCRLKNLLTGVSMTKTFRSSDKFDEPKLEHKNLRYSYLEGDHYVFVDENYEQISISGEIMGDLKFFLAEDMPVEIMFWNNKPIDIVLPTFVEKEIIDTEPGARGNTVNNVFKPATIPGGFQIQVPLFINKGDIIKIDTRTGEYADRVRTK